MWRLLWSNLFLISLSFGASRGLSFVIVAFAWYPNLYFCVLAVLVCLFFLLV